LQALVRDALAGHRPAQRKLIQDILAPVVQARVARLLLRRAGGRSGLRQEMMDLCQQVFVHLLSKDVLAQWDASQGPLSPFVGVVAENHVKSILRSRIRSPFTEVATEPETIELALPGDGHSHETALISREALRRLEAELGDGEIDDVYAFFVDERSIEEMCALTGKSREAVYKQRQRLRERVRRILEEEMSSPGSSRRKEGEVLP
jgi:RNA polymerase sigma-70 factor (ECF subfamily)